jgi:NAD(P)-dependent dehydrogenase (short-subunit alcohol dehydrogenase family)
MGNGGIEGKRAVITGAGSGMGRAAAVRFAHEGAWLGPIDIDQVAAAATAAPVCPGVACWPSSALHSDLGRTPARFW